MIKETVRDVLKEIAGIKDLPEGAYNIRVDGESVGRSSTAQITVMPKANTSGLDIRIAPGTKNDRVYIPVVISESGIEELVYNDFFIGEDVDVTIVAGCGIHNCGEDNSKHNGIHTFYVGKNAKVVYIEKHFGSGDGAGERIMNPVTNVFLEDGSYLEMDTVQIKGVDSTQRITNAELGDNSTLIIKEKLMTHGKQYAISEYDINMKGANSSANIISRSVAAGSSEQIFVSKIFGGNSCNGHSECDAIIMDNARVMARPEIDANHVDAFLIHEAAIGKIAGEQLIKLMTLGLTESEAEQQIVNGFLK